jgi:hypothetical protein
VDPTAERSAGVGSGHEPGEVRDAQARGHALDGSPHQRLPLTVPAEVRLGVVVSVRQQRRAERRHHLRRPVGLEAGVDELARSREVRNHADGMTRSASGCTRIVLGRHCFVAGAAARLRAIMLSHSTNAEKAIAA